MPEDQNQKKQISIFKKLDKFIVKLQGVSLSQKLFFTKNLGVMMKSGLSLSVAVKTLSRQTPNKLFKEILCNAYEQIEKGRSLSSALSAYTMIFSEVFSNMISTGEKSGNLEKILKELTIQMKKTHELTSKVKSALAYPCFILAAMLGIGTLMIIFVVPQIMEIFSDINATLPLPTRILIGTSNFVNSYILWIVPACLILLVIFIRYIRTKSGKHYLHLLFLKLPIFKTIVRKINLAKFSRTFSSLLATDIPIVQTIQITGGVLGNTIYKNFVIASSERIKKGEPIAKVLGENPELFPPIITQMIEVGEQTGTLDNILDDLAEFYEDDVKNTMDSLASIIEPVLILGLGIAVAGMAISIIMPMYSITEQM